MIHSIEEYLKYFQSIRRRTIIFIETIPVEKIDWSPGEGEFTCGEIIRHLGSIQVMNWQAFAGNPWKYGGHGTSLGITKQESLAYLEKSNLEATALLEKLPDADLTKKISDLANNSTTAWRILMATVEHEIHHRSQLASYLYLMGVEPPQLYGVYMEKLPKT